MRGVFSVSVIAPMGRLCGSRATTKRGGGVQRSDFAREDAVGGWRNSKTTIHAQQRVSLFLFVAGLFAATTGRLRVLTTHTNVPEVTQTTVQAHFFHALQILTA